MASTSPIVLTNSINMFKLHLCIAFSTISQTAGAVEETGLWGRSCQHDSHGQRDPAPDSGLLEQCEAVTSDIYVLAKWREWASHVSPPPDSQSS